MVNRSAANPLPEEPWPLSARSLLSKRENEFYHNLLALYPGHQIFVQVALSQLINVDPNHPECDSIRARYKQLVADFVLCGRDLSVIAVIELDDRSHERADRQDADARKNKALADAGIRLVRVPAGRLPTAERLRKLLDANRPAGDRTDTPTLHAPEPELSLVDEVAEPAAPIDHTESDSRVFKQIILKTIVCGILIVAGWFVYTEFLGFTVQRAFQTLAVSHAVPHTVTPSSPKSATLKPTLISAAPAVTGPSAYEFAVQKQQALQATNALQKKKDLAWAAFYSAPASCEQPADWSAQVECGNQYMRAKKLFEQRWATSEGN
jgi:hypothetical protein